MSMEMRPLDKALKGEIDYCDECCNFVVAGDYPYCRVSGKMIHPIMLTRGQGSGPARVCKYANRKIGVKDTVVSRDCFDRLLAENDELRKNRPVVFCRDCRYCLHDDKYTHWCNGFCSPARLVSLDDYCSRGARK